MKMLKLGGSLLTNKQDDQEASFRDSVARRLTNEIAEVDPGNLLIGYGGGAFGHPAASEAKLNSDRPHHNPAGASHVQQRMDELGLHVQTILNERLNTFHFRTSALWEDGSLRAGLIQQALDRELIPVVRGDVVLTDEGARIVSTERVFQDFARWRFKHDQPVKRVGFATSEDGVYGPGGDVMSEINDMPDHLNSGDDATGGMAHKVQLGLWFARRRIETCIFNGLSDGRVKGWLLKEQTTRTIIRPKQGSS